MKSYKQVIEDLEAAIKEISRNGISIDPLNKAVEELKLHTKNIEEVEEHIDAVRNEVMKPLEKVLDQNKRAGTFSIWGFWIGAFGLFVTAVSLIYTTFIENQNKKNEPLTNITKNDETKLEYIESSIKELNYYFLGLNENYQPKKNELKLGQFVSDTILINNKNVFSIEAYIPKEIEMNSKWYPIVNLKFSKNGNPLGIKGLIASVSLINNSNVATVDEPLNSIQLSENDCFVLFEKYKFRIKRILRKESHILNICDKEEGVIIERIE